MKLHRRKPTRDLPELNITSMIDVVFLLLIFFICTASFKIVEKALPTQLPSISNEKTSRDLLEPVRIKIRSLSDGVGILCDASVCSNFDHLFELLKQRRNIADVPVIIEGQGDVAFGYLIQALDTCHMADLKKVIFSVRGGDS